MIPAANKYEARKLSVRLQPVAMHHSNGPSHDNINFMHPEDLARFEPAAKCIYKLSIGSQTVWLAFEGCMFNVTIFGPFRMQHTVVKCHSSSRPFVQTNDEPDSDV